MKSIQEILTEYEKAKEEEDPTAGGWLIQELKKLIECDCAK